MRHPVTDLAGHLMWTTSGTVWATWRLDPLPYGRRPVKEKRAVKDLHRLMVRALPGEAMLQGVSVSLDPTAIVERMLEGIDLAQCPAWVAEAEANLDRLSDPQLALGERVYYLSVPLANTGQRRWSAPLTAATGSMKAQLGLPRSHPREQEIQHRLQQAHRIAQGIPVSFHPHPVSVAEHVWLAAHQQSRGMQDIPPQLAVELGGLVATSGAAMPEPVLDPGARSDVEGKRALNPLTRRVLKVTNPDLPDEPSYQALMVMAATPLGGVVFPGSELLSMLDNLGPEVDWVIRMKITSRDKVMRVNRKAVRELNDQFDQREADDNGDQDLTLAGELLEEYRGLFAGDRLEVEVEHTIVVATGHHTFEGAQANAEQITRTLGELDFKFDRPVGAEEGLWWAMHAGVPSGELVRSYAQFTTSDKFACLVPVTTTRLGGRRGPAAALNQATARADVVHLDPGGYPELDKSGSMAWVGELGAGKSYGMKSINAFIVARKGQMLAIDKSAEGEWATFATVLGTVTGTQSVIVDPTDPHWSMDPLRCMPTPEQASSATQAFLTTLLGCNPRKAEGVTLMKVLQPANLTAQGITSLQVLKEHLALSGLPAAGDLAEQMDNYAASGLGHLVFDQSLPAVPWTSSIVVWRTHLMSQPTEAELGTAHLFEQLSSEKIFGRAYYRLLMAAARRWAFADNRVVTCFNIDEAYDMFQNPENGLDAEHFVRQGRRAKAVLNAGSHNPALDFGTDTLRKLIPTRIVLRQTDADLAAASIQFLGIDPDDPDYAGMVTELRTDCSPVIPDVGVDPERRGEGFIRDAFGGVGRAKVLGPAQPELETAVDSTPPKSTVAL